MIGSPTATASGGIATFIGLSVGAVGVGYTIQVSGTGLTGVTTTSFSVTPAAAAQLELSNPPPAAVTAGVPFGLSFAIEDPYGNPEPSFSGPITIALSSDPGAGILNGQLIGTASGGQVAFSGLTLDTVGSGYTIDATSPGLSAVTTGSVDVVPAAAAKLVVSIQPPGSLAAGASFGLAVSAVDPFGNLATTYTGNVNLTLQGPAGPATLNGGPLTLSATGGVANFGARLAIDTAGSGYTIEATSGGLSPTTTRAISVTGLTPTMLGIEVQPPALLAPGATFGLVVGAVDPYGNVNAKFNGPITIALAPGSGATLGGVMTVTAVNGLASFQGLTLSELSNPAIILASTSSLAGTQTNPITPTVPAVVSSSPGPLVAMTSVQVVKIKTKKHKPAVPVIVIGFSGGLNAAEASSIGEYQLIVAGKKKSFTAKNAKNLPLASAVYSAANNAVTLTTKKKLVLNKLMELVVDANPPSGLQDTSGRSIDGNRDGQPGGNGVAVLKGKSVTLAALAVSPAMVNVLSEQGGLTAPRRKAR